MIKFLKKMFSISEERYIFEIGDLTSLLTVFNVTFIIMGYWWAPILGLVNCGIYVFIGVINRAHINTYITQAMLIILNLYFLNLW